MRWKAPAAILVAISALAGCGGGSDSSRSAATVGADTPVCTGIQAAGPIASALAAAHEDVYSSQVLNSTEVPGSVEVIARVCTSELDEQAARERASDIAATLARQGTPVALMKVSFYDGEAPWLVLTVDGFDSVLWDGDQASAFWEVTGPQDRVEDS